MPTPREELNRLRALASQQPTAGAVSPRNELERLRALSKQPEIVAPEPVDRRTLSFKPSGEALTPEMRRQRAPVAEGDIPLAEVPGRALERLPESVVEFGKALAQPVLHPIETAKSIGTLAQGLFQKLTPGVQPSEQAVDALGQFFSERYGGLENIKRTMANDPVGFAADLSAFMTGGAAIAAKVGVPAKVTGAVSKAGRAIEPVKAARLTASSIKSLAPKQFAERLHQSATKLSTAIKPEKRTRITQAALNEGIVPTKAGLAKTQALISKYTNKVDDIIEKGMKKGRGKEAVINTDDILKRLDDAKEFFGNSFLGDEYLDDINAVAEKFKTQFGDTITVKKAQEIKRNTQQVLRKSFGELKSAKVEAGKNIARGIREELEAVFPEIGKLNEKSRALIELNKELERAVGRISNRNLFGLTTKILGGLGISGQAPGAGLLLALSESIVGNPRIKARMAIALNKAGRRTTSKDILRDFKAGTARHAAFQVGRAKEITQEGES